MPSEPEFSKKMPHPNVNIVLGEANIPKNIFKTLLQGIQNFEVRIFEKYKSQKKIKTALKSFGRGL